MALLGLQHVTQRFGGLVAVNDLSFEVEAGSIVAMIGPNGAGKSTVFNLVTGIYKPTEGRIVFAGADVTGKATSAMPALESVMTGEHARLRPTLVESLLHPRRQRREEAAASTKALELLRFVGLE